MLESSLCSLYLKRRVLTSDTLHGVMPSENIQEVAPWTLRARDAAAPRMLSMVMCGDSNDIAAKPAVFTLPRPRSGAPRKPPRPWRSCFIASARPVFAGWENCWASLASALQVGVPGSREFAGAGGPGRNSGNGTG